MSTVPTSPPSGPRTGPSTSPTTAPHRSDTTRVRVGGEGAVTWSPTRDDLVDAGFALGLVVVGAVGWTSVYTWPGSILVPLVGALVGVAGAWVSAARRLSPLATLLVLVGAFVLGSGTAVPDQAVAGILPGPGGPGALLNGLVHGWADLITTAAPVGFDAGLGVVPYTCGFLAGALAMLIARRTDSALWPAAAPLGAMVAGLVFGDFAPVNVSAQGLGFAVGAVAWGSVRSNRPRRTTDGEIYWPRIGAGAVMLASVALVAQLAAPLLPGVDTADRTVLRDAVPPFDPANYPSPLAGLRSFRKEFRGQVYLRAEGVREGDRIRLATMDTYDGVVWTVGGSSSGSGSFERVGARIRYSDQPAAGPINSWPKATLDVTVADYQGVWVPTVGVPQSLTLAGPGAQEVRSALRVNRSTGTAGSAVPVGEGLRLTVDGRVRPAVTDAEKRRARPCSGGASIDGAALAALEPVQEVARTYIGDAKTPYGRAEAIEQRLLQGYFSDDLEDGTSEPVRAGHSAARLAEFLGVQRPIGNAEQYAAAMAVMANLSGLPARVVFGFAPDGTGAVDVKGEHADAWVEVCFADLGWVSFHPTPYDRPPVDEPEPLDTVDVQPQALSDQRQVNVPETIPEAVKQRKPTKPPRTEVERAATGGLPWAVRAALTAVGVPVALLALFATVVLALKSLRRKRRRTRGGPVQQLHGAWLEMVDRLRDLGHEPHPRATRREVATGAAARGHWPSGPAFAAAVDAHMFGPDTPDPAVVSDTWSDLGEHVRALHAPLSRRLRVRAAVSTASLRAPRTRRGKEAGTTPAGLSGARPGRRWRKPASIDEASDARVAKLPPPPVADLVDQSVGGAATDQTVLRATRSPQAGEVLHDGGAKVDQRSVAGQTVRAWRPVVTPHADATESAREDADSPRVDLDGNQI